MMLGSRTVLEISKAVRFFWWNSCIAIKDVGTLLFFLHLQAVFRIAHCPCLFSFHFLFSQLIGGSDRGREIYIALEYQFG